MLFDPKRVGAEAAEEGGHVHAPLAGELEREEVEIAAGQGYLEVGLAVGLYGARGQRVFGLLLACAIDLQQVRFPSATSSVQAAG